VTFAKDEGCEVSTERSGLTLSPNASQAFAQLACARTHILLDVVLSSSSSPPFSPPYSILSVCYQPPRPLPLLPAVPLAVYTSPAVKYSEPQ
jgi:hypothetical protein